MKSDEEKQRSEYGVHTDDPSHNYTKRDEIEIYNDRVYQVINSASHPRTLREKIRTCFDHIDEIEDWYGEEDLRNNLVDTVMEILETHFSVSTLEIEMGNVQIKSNNLVKDTTISIHGKPVSVTNIDWKMDAEDMLGKLRLTFGYPR